MKVQILKSELSSYWYADKIGEIFEVRKSNFGNKWERVDVPCFCIDKSDCVVIKEEKKISVKVFWETVERICATTGCSDVEGDCEGAENSWCKGIINKAFKELLK